MGKNAFHALNDAFARVLWNTVCWRLGMDHALQPRTSLTWFLLSQAWDECLKCKMNKIGFFFFRLKRAWFYIPFTAPFTGRGKMGRSQTAKKKKKDKEKGLRKWEPLRQISSASQRLQLAPVLKYIPWAEFSSKFMKCPSFLKGKDSFYSYFPNSQTKLFPHGWQPSSSAVRCCRGSRES